MAVFLCSGPLLKFFVPDNNHTTQENTGGAWFFIAATPKHQHVFVMKSQERQKFSPPHLYTHRTQRLVWGPGVAAATELLNIC